MAVIPAPNSQRRGGNAILDHTHDDVGGAGGLIKDDQVGGRIDEGTDAGNVGGVVAPSGVGSYVAPTLLSATGEGALATGRASGNNGGGILATGDGSLAIGSSADLFYAYTQRIEASMAGAIAAGRCTYGGEVVAGGYGSIACGATYGGLITTTTQGAMAMGYVAGGTISAGGEGSIAIGRSNGSISASGPGSIAIGRANNSETIAATAEASMQIGLGTNSEAVSLQVGTAGIHLHGEGAPTSPKNGDIWQDGSGNVIIRSNGANVTIA